MSKNLYFTLLVIISVVVCPIFIVIFFGNKETVKHKPLQTETQLPSAIELLPTATPTPIPYTAKFSLYTNGTYRDLPDKLFENASKSAFLQQNNEIILTLTKPMTWRELFNSLEKPFNVDTNCVIIHNDEKLCNNPKLKYAVIQYYLNGAEIDAMVLDTKIKPNDKLLIWIQINGIKPPANIH